MPAERMGIGRRVWRIGLLFVLVAVLAAALGARFFGPGLLREIVVLEAERQLGLQFRFSALRLTIVPARLAVDDLEVLDGRDTLLTARGVSFDLAVTRSLWDGAWIGDLAIDEPAVRITDAERLWQRVAPTFEKPATGDTGEESFRPRTLRIRSASIDVGWPREDLRGEIRELSLEARLGGILRPRFEFETAARVAAIRRGMRLDLDKLAIRGKTSPRGFVLDSLIVDGATGPLRAAGALEDGRLRGKLDWLPNLDPIFALLPEAGIVRGNGVIAATIAGTPAAPEAIASLSANHVRIDDVEFSGTGRLTTKGDSWKLDDATAEIFGGRAVGKAHGALKPRVPFEAQAKFTAWQPATFVRLFKVETPLRGDWSGDARIAGDLFGDDLHGGGSFTLAKGAERLAGTASFAVAKERVEVEGSLGSGAENQLRARYRTIHDADVAGDVEVRSNRLAAFAPFVGLDLEGRGRAQARFQGTVHKPSFGGDVELEDVAVLGIPLGAVRGPFEITGDGIASKQLEIADGELVASGSVAVTESQRNELRATLKRFSLARARAAVGVAGIAIPEIAGTADGTVQLSGPWRQPLFRSQTEVRDLLVAGEDGGAGRIAVARDEASWSADVDLKRGDGASLRFRGTRAKDGGLAGQVVAKGFRLEKIAAIHRELPTARGRVELAADLSGTETRPRGAGKLAVSGLELGEGGLGDGEFRLTADGTELAVDGGAAGIHLAASVAAAAPNAYRARFTWRDFEVGPFLSSAIALQITSSGEGELAGDRARPLEKGTARIARLSVGRAAERLELEGPAVVRIANGAIDLDEGALVGSGQRIVAGGHWSGGDSRFHATLAGDLAVLESLSTDVASARGRIDGKLEASRSGAAPWRFRGDAELADGALDLSLLVATTDVHAKLAIEDRKISVSTLGGKVGGGDFGVHGTIVLDGEWDLAWKLDQASLGVPSWIDYRAGGHGKIGGPFAKPLLEGEIEIDQAIYDRTIEWAEFLPWFRKQTRAAPASRPLPFDVHLHVVADGGVFVDNNLAKAEMRSDMTITGGAKSLGLDGTIDVLSGEFTFRRRRFTISSGLVRFHDDRPTNPDLAFSGETRVSTRDEEYEITVQVSGTADDPRIEFRADDPSLTENDVLALVTFGRTVAQLQSQGAGIELGEALALTAGPRGEQVEKELHTLIPVDRIEIEPSFSRVNGTSEPRLSVAKDLTERFSAVIGSGLGNERSQDVALEYQLTRKFSLQGIWESATKNDAGAFGANFKFRAPFRTAPRFSLIPGTSSRR